MNKYNLVRELNELLEYENFDAKNDEVQNIIHPDISFKYNSVNLVIGRRGSGKTHMIMMEALKIAILTKLIYREPSQVYSVYTQIHYITDKVRDDTFNKFAPYIKQTGLTLEWHKTEEALQLIRAIAQSKAEIADPNTDPDLKREDATCLNMRLQPPPKGIHPDCIIPHTLIIFDDCIGLFKKDTPLSKLLFENRQSRITYFLLLQDVQGISPSMKANIDSLTVFGGFPKNKWNILMYQMPAFDNYDYDIYVHLRSIDYVLFDYIDGYYEEVRRPDHD